MRKTTPFLVLGALSALWMLGCQQGKLANTSPADIGAEVAGPDGLGDAGAEDAPDTNKPVADLLVTVDTAVPEATGVDVVDAVDADDANDANDAVDANDANDANDAVDTGLEAGVQLCPGTAFPLTGAPKFAWTGNAGDPLCPFDEFNFEPTSECSEAAGVQGSLAVTFPDPFSGPSQTFSREWPGTLAGAWLRVRLKLIAVEPGLCEVAVVLATASARVDSYFQHDFNGAGFTTQTPDGVSSETALAYAEWVDLSVAITETGFHICSPNGDYTYETGAPGSLSHLNVSLARALEGQTCQGVLDRIELWTQL